MTPEDIKSKYSFRAVGMLNRAADIFRSAGFHVPKPVFPNTLLPNDAGYSKHVFWWTDVENEKNKLVQLQIMAAASEEVLKEPGKLRFSFCLYDLQFGNILGCRESQWVDRNDPQAVEEAVEFVESHMSVMLRGLEKLSETLPI